MRLNRMAVVLVVLMAAILPSLGFAQVEAQRAPNGFVMGLSTRPAYVSQPVIQPMAYPQGYGRYQERAMTRPGPMKVGLVARVLPGANGLSQADFALPLVNALSEMGFEVDYNVQDIYVLAVVTKVFIESARGGGGIFRNLGAGASSVKISVVGYAQLIEGTHVIGNAHFKGSDTARSTTLAYLRQPNNRYFGGGGYNGQVYSPPAGQVAAGFDYANRDAAAFSPNNGGYGGGNFATPVPSLPIQGSASVYQAETPDLDSAVLLACSDAAWQLAGKPERAKK